MPKDLMDYVVLPELCHLKELNHSGAFYALLDRVLPEWRERRQVWIEPKFAESKLWHHGRRFRWRGIQTVNIEALLRAEGKISSNGSKNGQNWLHSHRTSLKPLAVARHFLDFLHLAEQIRWPDPCST